MYLSPDLTANKEVGGWGKNFADTELDSDERRGTTSGSRWCQYGTTQTSCDGCLCGNSFSRENVPVDYFTEQVRNQNR